MPKGSRIWLAQAIRSAFREILPGMTCHISPAEGRGFAVKTGEDEILRVSARGVAERGSVAITGLGRVIARLKEVIGLEPAQVPAQQPKARPVLLLLYENSADLPALRKLSRRVTERDVVFISALEAVSDPEFTRRLTHALGSGKVDECLAIAGSGGGLSPALADLYQALRYAAAGRKPIRQACLLNDGRLGLLEARTHVPRVQGQDEPLEFPADEDPAESDEGPDPGG